MLSGAEALPIATVLDDSQQLPTSSPKIQFGLQCKKKTLGRSTAAGTNANISSGRSGTCTSRMGYGGGTWSPVSTHLQTFITKQCACHALTNYGSCATNEHAHKSKANHAPSLNSIKRYWGLLEMN
jgi:hypothetical protein